MYIGAFDSTYESSVDATGHLYVCGNTGGAPTIYQVAIQGGILGTVNTGPVSFEQRRRTPCSPVTDVLNPNVSGGATEWMFASAADRAGLLGVCLRGVRLQFQGHTLAPVDRIFGGPGGP